MGNVKVDLQVQTSASDGEYGLDRILDLAFKENIELLAITDHDTDGAWGNQDMLAACVELYNERYNHGKPVLIGPGARPGMFSVGKMQVIQGEEITCAYKGAEVHLLGYFLDRRRMEGSALEVHNRRMMHAHRNWARTLCAHLAKDGYPVSYEELLDATMSSYGLKPYVLPKLLQQRHGLKIASEIDEDGVPSIQNIGSWLNDRYHLSLEQFYRLPEDSSIAQFPTIRDAAEMVLEIGSVPVFSHPGRYAHVTDPRAAVQELLGWSRGLMGFEVYNKRHEPPATQRWEAAVVEANGLKTGGSDFHGHAHRSEQLGVDMRQEDVDALFARHQQILGLNKKV